MSSEATASSSCTLRGGEPLEAASAAVLAGAEGGGWARLGLLVNCCHPDTAVRAVAQLGRIVGAHGEGRATGGRVLVGAYANAFTTTTGNWMKNGEGDLGVLPADAFVAHAAALCDAGADIIGGCCGTTPTMMREVYRLQR